MILLLAILVLFSIEEMLLSLQPSFSLRFVILLSLLPRRCFASSRLDSDQHTDILTQ